MISPAHTATPAPPCHLSTFLNVETPQHPPQTVEMPRALNAFTIPQGVVTPQIWLASMTGSTFAANRSARLIFALRPRAAAARGLFGFSTALTT